MPLAVRILVHSKMTIDLKTKHNETLNTDTFKMSVEILNDLGYTDLSTCEDDKYTDIVEPKV